MCCARMPARYTLIDCGFKRSAKKATNKESVSSDAGTAVKTCFAKCKVLALRGIVYAMGIVG